MHTLYGTYSDNCCGFCLLHHAGVTQKQMERKGCMEKHCQHFRKYKDHPYWEHLEYEKKEKQKRKALRKKRKIKQQAYFEKIQRKKVKPKKQHTNTAPEADYVLIYSTENPNILAVTEFDTDMVDSKDTTCPSDNTQPEELQAEQPCDNSDT